MICHTAKIARGVFASAEVRVALKLNLLEMGNVDTNGDGVVSWDELDASIAGIYEKIRAALHSGRPWAARHGDTAIRRLGRTCPRCGSGLRVPRGGEATSASLPRWIVLLNPATSI